MSMRLRTSSLAVLLISAVAVPAVAEETISYAFTIDCYHSSDKVTGEGTDDIIGLTWWGKRMWLGESNQNIARLDLGNSAHITLGEPTMRFDPFSSRESNKNFKPSPDTPKCSSASDAEYSIEIDTWDGKRTIDPVTKIVLRTNGTDAFFIDEARLFNDDGNLIAHWGRDDGKGYCLSKDPKDAQHFGSKYVDGCHSAINFLVKDNKVTIHK